MTRTILYVCALVFAAAPAALSMWFAASFAPVNSKYAVAAAVVFAVALTLAKVVLPSLFHGRGFREALPLRGTWLCVFLLDAALVGGGMAQFNADFRGPLIAQHDAHRAARLAVKTAEASLAAASRPGAGVPTPRSYELVFADLRAARAVAPRDCSRPPSSLSDACRNVSVYEREQAQLDAIKRLSDAVVSAEATLAKTPDANAYPEGQRVSELIRILGFEVEAARVAGVVALLFLIVTDAGAIVLYRYADTAKRLAVPQAQPVATPRPKSSSPQAGAVLSWLSAAATGGTVPAVRVHTSGRLALSQRAAAKAHGISQRALQSALSELQAAGRISYSTTSQGTFVAVLS